jgi:peptidoglycan/xylan/chitin deacetylase (PgdA/CDA1 family)
MCVRTSHLGVSGAVGLALIAGAAALPASGAEAGRSAGSGAPPLHADARDVPASPLDLVGARFGQRGSRIELELRTAQRFDAARLDTAAGRALCVRVSYGASAASARRARAAAPSERGRHVSGTSTEMSPRPGGDAVPRERICVGGDAATRAVFLRITRLDAHGAPAHVSRLRATVQRPDATTVRATFTPAAAGLHVPGRFSWRAVSAWTDPAAVCATPGGCVDVLPDRGDVPARLTAPPKAPTGCSARAPYQVRHSPHRTRAVALTFDDGPGPATPQVLRILEREHVPATFFVIGRQVAGHGALLKRMLRDGDMIGNHTWSHADVAGGGPAATAQIEKTQRAVRAATGGFTPCLLRPPYGATSGALTGLARSLGLDSVLWDVDPQDWREPGVSAIESTIARQATPGSIVLMHDGGGPRGQTVAALPHVIAAFRRRGYRFVTVVDLLRLKTTTKEDR